MSEILYFYSGVFFVFGALLGSFSNVVIYRLPVGKSVVSPRSSCSSCQKTIPLYLNIPILSWFFLKGKCAFCSSRISFRYPLVEFLTGAVFLGLYLKEGLSFSLIEKMILCWGLIVVSFIDLDHYIIPDKITYPGIILGVVGALLNPDRTFLGAIMGLLMGGGFLWSIAVIYFKLKKEEGMGGGDIKLLAWIGAVLGWMPVPFIILVSSLLGSVIGISLILKNKSSVKKVIPFGPFISIATVVYIFFGNELTSWYLKIFFPWF